MSGNSWKVLVAHLNPEQILSAYKRKWLSSIYMKWWVELSVVRDDGGSLLGFPQLSASNPARNNT